MNVRNMLLAGLLFVAPCSMVNADGTTTPQQSAAGTVVNQDPQAPANPVTPPTTPPTNPPAQTPPPATPAPTPSTGVIAGIAGLIGAFGQKGLDGVDFVADWTINIILNAVANHTSPTTLQPYVKPAGRVVVISAAVTAIYHAYKTYVEAQNSDTDNDQVFFQD